MLEAMSAGGIYDHLGGGFARYSTDAEWHVPHFEKMLYDNAQILELLALAHSLRPDPIFAARARETFGWLMREMRVGDAFAASLDADQDGEEGLFYVWERRGGRRRAGRRRDALQGRLRRARGGNWEGRNVLRRITPRGSPDEEAGLAASRAKLFALARGAFEARPRRQGSGRLERPDDRRARARQRGVRRAGVARDRARRVRLHHDEACATPTAGSLHAWREGHPGAPRAARRLRRRWPAPRFALFEATGEPGYLEAARRLASEAIDLFGDGAGGFFLTAQRRRRRARRPPAPSP